ncbi:glycosyltransferase [Bythopirellula polymerisocia]|uniref:glycosyltransferase n=1 Tax=Bythopirellula polymerisocia TaxID=2528003 RepID=UPI0018D2BE45|nr:glycosyltransferase family 2 protein [Bythopirellula polymerisocia]
MVVLVGLVVVQSFLVWRFVRTLRAPPAELISDEVAPQATIVLCLRGTDPFLADCLRGLTNQDYPRYVVRIVVDSPDDPAHEVVKAFLRESDTSNVHVENLVEKSVHCSLKCSSLRQVMLSLDPEYEIVAQLDADTIAHPTWLRELATGLAPADVGAATGNRWYMPNTYSIGALVRYTWNAAAIVQMYWYRIAWGGTLAIKTKVFRESDLLDKWGKAFCEDTMLHAQLKKIGLRVAFVPSLMMINREDTSVSSFISWSARQLICARLYHPAWPLVLGHGVLSTMLPLLAVIVFIATVLLGDLSVAISMAAVLGLVGLSWITSLWPMERAVRQIAENRGDSTNWLTITGALKCMASMPVTQLVYPQALASAVFTRVTNWRGIDYRIEGPWQIYMEEYEPYSSAGEQSNESL